MPRLTDDEVRRRYGLPPGTRILRLTPDALGRVRVTPDAFALVEVESTIEGAAWDRPAVVAGATARLVVQTAFVGEGTAELPPARVDVTVRDGRDRVVGRGSGTVSRDRATVEVVIDRRAAERDPDGVLCAADVEIRDLGLKTVSGPLVVLPFAELVDARWSVAEARDGDVVTLSCRLSGSPAGVERAGREPAEVEVLRGDEGGGPFEPVATLRAVADRGLVEVRWRAGYDAGGKAQIATQAELDAVAARTGAAPGRYARPAWRFRVRVAGLEVESPEMGYRDHVDLAWDAGTDRPAAGAPVEVRLADGTTREEMLGDDGRLHLADVPPGPVEAAFGPDPRTWAPRAEIESPVLAAPDPLPDPTSLVPPPEKPVLLASAGLDPALLADLAGLGPPDDDESFVEWLWGTMIGDFNEDASYDQIVANIGASFIPGVGQVMDVRDVFAGLYLLTKDRGWRDGLKWLALFVTLVGIIPVLGDALKGVFRIALRSIRRGADDVAGAAAQALDAAFAKAKAALQKAGLDDLDNVPDVATWIRDLDVDWLVGWARDGVDWVAGRAAYVFEWAAESAEAGVLRVGEAWAEGMSQVRLLAGQAFDVLRRRPPRAAAPSVSLAATLRGVAHQVEGLRLAANARVDDGFVRLYNKLRELRGQPPVQRGRGPTGQTVEPSGSGSTPVRASDEVIAARRKAAEDFYARQGYELDQIADHTRGIDYNHPVEVVPLDPGRRFRSYQGGRTWQGNYYYEGVETPSRLGISPIAEDKATGEILAKDIFEYEVVRSVQVLRSTSAEVVDHWSVPSIPFPAEGGAIQFFIPDKSALRILD